MILTFPLKDSTTRLLNVVLLGVGFLFIFSAFSAMGSLQTVIIDNAKNENSSGFVENFDGEGFTGQSIVYAVSSVCNWMAPSVIAVIGAKLTMAIGGTMYMVYIATFFYLAEPLLYTGAALMGFGVAMIWTAQGAFISANSSKENIARNSGLFWAIYKWAGIAGNLFAYFQFRDIDDISANARNVFISVLLCIGFLGVLVILSLRPIPAKERHPTRGQQEVESPLAALKKVLKLLGTSHIHLLAFFSIHVGTSTSLYFGVYPPSLGFTMSFEDPKSLPGLHGIALATGSMLSGLALAVFGRVTNRIGRYPMVILATLLLLVAYAIAFVNLPDNAPFGDTYSDAIISPSNAPLAIFCSLLFGVADGINCTQVMSLLGDVYSNAAGQAFAIHKFVQQGFMAVGFGYSNFLTLHWQLVLLTATGVIGTVCFAVLDVQSRRENAQLKQDEEVVKETAKMHSDASVQS